MSTSTNPTIKNLLGEALRDSGELAQKEFSLFRAEMTQNVKMMFMGIATPFKDGECVEVTLTFAHAGNVPVVLAIGGVAADAPPMHDMKGM